MGSWTPANAQGARAGKLRLDTSGLCARWPACHSDPRGLVSEAGRDVRALLRILERNTEEALDIPLGPDNRIELGDFSISREKRSASIESVTSGLRTFTATLRRPRGHAAFADLTLDAVPALEGCVQAGDGVGGHGADLGIGLH